MKNIFNKFLVFTVIISMFFSFNTNCFADIVDFSDFEPESINEKYGYIEPGGGHRWYPSRRIEAPYWETYSFIINATYTLIILILILIILRRIMKVKENPQNRKIHLIVSIVVLIIYIFFCLRMIDDVITINTKPVKFGIITDMNCFFAGEKFVTIERL